MATTSATYMYIVLIIFQVNRPRHRPAPPEQPCQRPHDHIIMRAPEAICHARFLASCLCIMKLALLADNLLPGLMTLNMRVNIVRMALYIALFHGPWFLQARLPSAAPSLDMELWHMCLFEVRSLF